MKFNKLVKIITEAKGTKPGERYFNARNSEPSDWRSVGVTKSGVGSSPIGKDTYNPVIEPRISKDPSDKGMGDMVSLIKLLGKAFQVLKNDDTFIDQMRGVMNGFKKNRSQISAYQENILKTKPKTIDNVWGEINRLIRIVNDPSIKKNKDQASKDQFLADLEDAKERKDLHEAEYDDVVKQVENISLENEELNQQFLDQMLVIIDNTARRLYKKYSEEAMTDNTFNKELSTVVPLHELDYDMLEKKVASDFDSQLRLLELLISEDENLNPMLAFLAAQQRNYDEAKQRYFEVKRGDNYSVAIEQLYRTLPLFTLINYFSHVILKSPSISLSRTQKKRSELASGADNILKRLQNVKTDKQFEDIRPDLVEYIEKLDVDANYKKMLLSLANGPFTSSRGANAAIKIVSSLKSRDISLESFDNIFEKIINEKAWDEDDFKIDTMEILSLITPPNKNEH